MDIQAWIWTLEINNVHGGGYPRTGLDVFTLKKPQHVKKDEPKSTEPKTTEPEKPVPKWKNQATLKKEEPNPVELDKAFS